MQLRAGGAGCGSQETGRRRFPEKTRQGLGPGLREGEEMGDGWGSARLEGREGSLVTGRKLQETWGAGHGAVHRSGNKRFHLGRGQSPG